MNTVQRATSPKQKLRDLALDALEEIYVPGTPIEWAKCPPEQQRIIEDWVSDPKDPGHALVRLLAFLPHEVAVKWFENRPERLEAWQNEVRNHAVSRRAIFLIPKQILHGATPQLIARNYAAFIALYEEAVCWIKIHTDTYRVQNSETEDLQKLQKELDAVGKTLAQTTLKYRIATKQVERGSNRAA